MEGSLANNEKAPWMEGSTPRSEVGIDQYMEMSQKNVPSWAI